MRSRSVALVARSRSAAPPNPRSTTPAAARGKRSPPTGTYLAATVRAFLSVPPTAAEKGEDGRERASDGTVMVAYRVA
jgi:hypothetical protein